MTDPTIPTSLRGGFEVRDDAEGEMMAVDEKPKAAASPMKLTGDDSRQPEESRDDCGVAEAASAREVRDERQDVPKKKSKASGSAKSKKATSGRQTQTRRNAQDSQPGSFQQQQPRGALSYHPHQVTATMHGSSGPRGHPTTGSYSHHPYGYTANTGPHDPYRGPHQHPVQYSMPPLPHPSQQGAHYGAPAAPFHPGQHHLPTYGTGPYHPPPSYPYHGALHHQRPSAFQQPTTSSSEDTGSIGSTKSKGSKSGKSSSSTTSRKKRTIEGVDKQPKVNAQQQALASAFAFRRTQSISSTGTSSTVTAGNNTSTETPNLADDSPQKGRDLPPLSSRPDFQPSANMLEVSRKGQHRRDFSGTSTASSLSVGGLSLSSYDTRGSNVDTIMRKEDAPLVRSSPKRRRGQDGGAVSSNDSGLAPTRLKQLSVQDDNATDDHRENLFLTLSTSPINSDVEATPVSKNTKKSEAGTSKATSSDVKQDLQTERAIPHPGSLESMDRDSDTPTPPMPNGSVESDMNTDEHLLNRHLRGQSFTPLPHIGQYSESREGNTSPPGLTTNSSFATLGAQLSWDITGDAPSLGDLAEWEEERQSKVDPRRPSPATFAVWKEGEMIPSLHYQPGGGDGRNFDNIRLSALSPHSHSDVDMEDSGLGATTPLPMFFDHQERENGRQQRPSSVSGKKDNKAPPPSIRTGLALFGDPEHIHQLFATNGGRGTDVKRNQKAPTTNWNYAQTKSTSLQPMHFPPTPVYTASDLQNDGFGRSPHTRDGHHDFFPSSNMLGMHHAHGLANSGANDRIRNLRGRASPGQRVPMAHHQLPPHLTSSHPPNLTSPIGLGQVGKGMWSPGGGIHHSLQSPHRMMHGDANSSSKRKCLPMKPPIPTKFQGDIEKYKTAHVPEFTSLVNFPMNMSQSKTTNNNLPEGVRCCVMCGQACPCSAGNKHKKKKTSGDGSLTARNGNTQNADKQGLAIIPSQNKGLCTLCDVNVWIVASSGLEIKWCKGCKNFRPWAAFGDKGLATKCLRCRDRQREKYAIQKEEKERARAMNKAAKKANKV